MKRKILGGGWAMCPYHLRLLGILKMTHEVLDTQLDTWQTGGPIFFSANFKPYTNDCSSRQAIPTYLHCSTDQRLKEINYNGLSGNFSMERF